MRRPVLFWHNYKSVTMVGREIKTRENRESLRIYAVSVQHLVIWGPQCLA